MQSVVRTWNCRNCGRSNQTEIAQDGTVRCEHCSRITRIQPSRTRASQKSSERKSQWTPAAP